MLDVAPRTVQSVTGASVQLAELTRDFGPVRAVDSLSLDVDAGRFLALLGPSGSGKTTALHLIAGLLAPTSGSIRIGGVACEDVPADRRNVGIVFQNYALFPHLTVAQNLAFPLEMRGVPRPEITQRVTDVLRLVDLEGMEERRPRQLSGGQQQRVALARVLIYRPQVVLMDEPLGALDRNLRQQMQLEIKRLHEELGLTIVYVTHDQSEALAMADQIAVIDHGRIVQSGPPRQLYDRPVSQFVATFLGEANLLPGTISSVDAASGVAYARFLPGLGSTGTLAGGLRVGTPVTVVVRPEDMLVSPAPNGTEGWTARVAATAFAGDAFRIQLTDGQGRRLLAKMPVTTAAPPAVGSEVVIGWPDHRATFVVDVHSKAHAEVN
ncbi:MAG TPA: ABC transporter ATP-binding protein [Candidatus Limnocylindrales bacterium]|nr:ABC transporter ATP-binding protein [Candidatus Limnocylindrales bacterium]